MIHREQLLLLVWSLVAGMTMNGCAQAPTAVERPDRLAIRVETDGLYRLSAAELDPLGWDVSQLDHAHLRLSQGGSVVPFALRGQGRERQLIFYGRVTPSRYYGHNIYWLEMADGGAAPLPERKVAPAGDEAAHQLAHTVRFEEDLTYVTQVKEGDPWLGTRLYAPGTIVVPLTTPHLVEGPATLRVQLWAASQSPAKPDHHLLLHLNGQAVADVHWDGIGFHLIEADLPAGTLQGDTHTLSLNAPGDTGARLEVIYLDWVEITYWRALVAEGDSLAFAGQAGSYALSGFRQGDIELWEMTDAARPVRLQGHIVGQVGNLPYSLRFTDTAVGQRRYQAAARGALLRPAAVYPAAPLLTPPPAGADYVIIVHPSLREAIKPLAEWRAKQGLRVAAITTEQIYDRFSHGLPDPAALREFLRWGAREWPPPAPRFVLLAGDASYDPRDRLRAPFKDLVPTWLVSTQHMGETASDDWFADLDEDGRADLAIGRLPAQEAQQMRAMVDKILAYEQGAPGGEWRRRLLFVSDDDDPLFVTLNEGLIAALSPGYQAIHIVVGRDAEPRSMLLAALNEGASVVNYVGHGAIDVWAKEDLFRADDVATLDQQGRLPLVIAWACLSGYFHHPQAESLAERLLAEKKGAIAALVPTSETMAADQQLLADALFRYLFAEATLGEAILRARQEMDPSQPGLRDVLRTFVLLGDPALRLVQP